MIKKSKQIIVISQLFFIFIGTILIAFSNLGLVGLVIAQGISMLVSRILSYKAFFDEKTKTYLNETSEINHKEILKNISPNALKIGLTSLGGYLVNRSSVFIGSLFLPLASIASFGITKQVIDLLVGLSGLWFSTYYPQLIQYRVQNQNEGIKDLYLKSKIVYIIIFLLGGLFLVIFGNSFLSLIRSNTFFISRSLFILFLLVSFLEGNHSWAASIIMTKNEVPFFKAALFSGGATVVLLVLFLNFTKMELLSFILAPGIAQLCYQNWKWPLVVKKELQIGFKDYKYVLKNKIIQNK